MFPAASSMVLSRGIWVELGRRAMLHSVKSALMSDLGVYYIDILVKRG